MNQAVGWLGSRLLLKRLRDVMATGAPAQARLDQIVRLVAADMVAEVCSVYVMRAGEVLELFATEGLNQAAVHKTRLRTGEGLIGDIAAHCRPLALADAWSHPSFAYRPETGEDIYRSFLGVPIHRGGRALGVLAVQNKTQRGYADEEVEALETIAMVLAELVSAGALINPLEAAAGDGLTLKPGRLDGIMLNPGLAMGEAVLHRPRVTIRHMVADDPEIELSRLLTAVSSVQSALDNLLASDVIAISGEFREIMETYRMFAEDRGWLSRIREAVRTGLTAEAAVQKVQNDMRARMREVTDPYLKERLHDLEDLTNRLLVQLSGPDMKSAPDHIPENYVLVARTMGPAELLDYDRKHLRALVLEEGSPTGHVAIVARAFDIPVVGKVKDVLNRVEAGDLIVVDGDNGQVYIRPGDDILETIRHSIGSRSEQRAQYAALKHLPATTLDGHDVTLMVNAGLPTDVMAMDEAGAAGVGLYRTEIGFMVRTDFPDVADQTALYSKTLELAGGKPVTFRTLDCGGDKALPYFHVEGDENPAMGWRAIRIGLDRPAILRQQLRALIAAAAGRSLSIMFPMVAEVAEFDAAKALFDLELDHARTADATLPSEIRLGVMIEVPSLLWQLDQLLSRVDFVSIGSNDLAQFLFAHDRGSPRLGKRFDPLSPPMLNVLHELVQRTNAAGVSLTLCGEMAGKPIEAMALLGLGFRCISMTAASIGPVKMMTRSLEIGPLTLLLERLRLGAAHSVREELRLYALDHGVVL